LNDIKSLGVEDWLASLSRTEKETVLELAPGTKKKIRDLMHVLFEHAIRNEWTTRNPITSVRQGSKRQSVPTLLTVEQLSMLLFQSLDLHERVMVFLDFGTGICSSRQHAFRQTWSLLLPYPRRRAVAR
jgi:site-specific recombinase XerD